MKTTLEQYRILSANLERLRSQVLAQLNELVEKSDITLGFPIESRTKTWESISEKGRRKKLNDDALLAIPDLVGFRIILLFQRDIEAVISQLEAAFTGLQKENAGARLGEAQFGYASIHLLCEIPNEWNKIPTFKGLNGIKFEIQVRSLAQHIWASASHKLQYKNEVNVPSQVKRSLHRVSAILELIDLELDRVLVERASYKSDQKAQELTGELNTDLLKLIMDKMLPSANKNTGESYDELVDELIAVGLTTAEETIAFIEGNLAYALDDDKKRVEGFRKSAKKLDQTPERDAVGVYYAHTGLMRTMIQHVYEPDEIFDEPEEEENEANPEGCAVAKPTARP